MGRGVESGILRSRTHSNMEENRRTTRGPIERKQGRTSGPETAAVHVSTPAKPRGASNRPLPWVVQPRSLPLQRLVVR